MSADDCINNGGDASLSVRGAPGGRAYLLHHQDEEQLSAADERTFDDERAAFAQLRFGLEQEILFFVELEVDEITGRGFAASIDVQSKIFARGRSEERR